MSVKWLSATPEWLRVPVKASFRPRVCWLASAPPSGRAWTLTSRWSCCCWRCGCGCWGPPCSTWSLCSWPCCVDLLWWRERAAEKKCTGGWWTHRMLFVDPKNRAWTHYLLSEFVVKSLQTLVGIIKFPPCLLLKKNPKNLNFYLFLRRSNEPLSARLTHRVGGYSQTLLDQPLKGGLQDHMLIGDGLLHDFLSWDWLQRINNTANC